MSVFENDTQKMKPRFDFFAISYEKRLIFVNIF